jgi:hypothetical protein
MRKTFDSINALNLKFVKEGSKFKMYLPLKEKVLTYLYDDGDNKIEKQSEYPYNDEILNFHIEGDENLIIIGKNNKSITTYDSKLTKLNERYLFYLSQFAL